MGLSFDEPTVRQRESSSFQEKVIMMTDDANSGPSCVSSAGQNQSHTPGLIWFLYVEKKLSHTEQLWQEQSWATNVLGRWREEEEDVEAAAGETIQNSPTARRASSPFVITDLPFLTFLGVKMIHPSLLAMIFLWFYCLCRWVPFIFYVLTNRRVPSEVRSAQRWTWALTTWWVVTPGWPAEECKQFLLYRCMPGVRGRRGLVWLLHLSQQPGCRWL